MISDKLFKSRETEITTFYYFSVWKGQDLIVFQLPDLGYFTSNTSPDLGHFTANFCPTYGISPTFSVPTHGLPVGGMRTREVESHII